MVYMKLKSIFWLLIIIGLGAAFFLGNPERPVNKVADWVKNTELGARFLVDGEQSLPGPLRGLLDPAANSNLTTQGVVDFTNLQREQNGLAPLHFNTKLSEAAEAKIDDMFANQYFEHESPDGKSPADIISATGYDYIVVGENLALGNFKNDEVLVQAWMDSPGHRANILNGKFLEIGVAVRKGEFEGKTVWLAVQEFGSPLSTCPIPPTSIKSQIDKNRTQLSELQTQLEQQRAKMNAARYTDSYNDEVNKYNAIANQINDLANRTQQLVENYNTKVNEFNRCLETSS